MVQRLRIASESGLRRLSILPRPVIVVGYLLLFVLWTLLVSDTIQIWQQRQVVIERRRLEAAFFPPTSTPLPPTSTPTAQPTVAAAAQPAPAAPTPRPISVVHPKTGRSIAAWLPTSFDAERARASFDANKDILDEVSPFWYTTNIANGALIPDIGARDRQLVEAAHAADVLVTPTIHNVMAPEAIVPLLRDPARRKQHIDAIMHEVRIYGYDGIDIDYESLPASSREAYSTFMQELSAALRAEGKLLTVAVHAKTDDGGGLGGFQDWKLLGEICDRVRIMTYDFHWRGGGPGPIAPMSWVAAVGEYARSVVPPEKIQIGIPFYGYNWGEGEDAVAQTWTDIQRLIDIYQPDVNLAARDSSGPIEESWFTYRRNGQRRTVWFADHRSLQAKLNLVEQLDLAGIAIWRLGNEDPQNWEVVRKQLVENPSVVQRVVNTYLPDH
ncbi:MAG TPA: glycosyl hydrolase family 18 protein [Herpetosiphonaceae bacterium]